MGLFRFAVFLVLMLGGCAGGGIFADKRLDDALAMGRKAGFETSWVRAGDFVLLTQTRGDARDKTLRVYIEGDGFAYMSPGRVSIDPTPKEPVALALASLDPASGVVWIARPCQYAMLAGLQKKCSDLYWTKRRMAPEIVAALDEAVTQSVKTTGASRIELVGFSGGGSAAVLLAARRSDVAAVRTVAGNLDYEAFARYHEVDPMDGSLDAMGVAEKVGKIPQIHFVGGEDDIVPPALSQGYLRKTGSKAKAVTVPEAGHTEGWAENWPRLLQTALP